VTEAEFDLLFKQSNPGLTDIDSVTSIGGISETEFDSLFQGAGEGVYGREEEEEEEDIVEETLQLGPAVPEPYPTIDRPPVVSVVAGLYEPGTILPLSSYFQESGAK